MISNNCVQLWSSLIDINATNITTKYNTSKVDFFDHYWNSNVNDVHNKFIPRIITFDIQTVK